MTRRRILLLGAAALAAGCLAVGGGIAAPAPASAQLCIPIILPCPRPGTAPSPTPTGTPAPTPSVPVPGAPGIAVPPAPGAGEDPATPGLGADEDGASEGEAPKTETPKAEAIPLKLLPKDDSMVFTQPSAQLGVTSLSFTGLKGIAPVSVRLADGTRIAALRLRAESITMDGFSLTVRAETGPSLVTKADRMALRGDVSVYVNSLTATTSNGRSLTLGADTPPPKDGVTPTLLRVTLGLVGSRADQIVYTNTDQKLND